MRYRIAGMALVAVTAIALAGCNSTTGGSAAPSTDTGATTAPEATAAAPTDAAPSQGEASFAIPSFAFPSSDKELEALLPAEMCGATVQKLSMGPEMFETAADPEFTAVLDKLGKSVSDVSFAIAAPLTASADGCSAGIFRIKGADGDKLKAAFLEEAQKEGNTFTQKSLGGKDVYADPTSDSFGYVYFKNDAAIFASASTDDKAAEILALLP